MCKWSYDVVVLLLASSLLTSALLIRLSEQEDQTHGGTLAYASKISRTVSMAVMDMALCMLCDKGTGNTPYLLTSIPRDRHSTTEKITVEEKEEKG